MKSPKLLLDIECEDEEITLGLVRLAKQVPDFEFFYHVNALNSFQFSRITDLIFQGYYFDYEFPKNLSGTKIRKEPKNSRYPQKPFQFPKKSYIVIKK